MFAESKAKTVDAVWAQWEQIKKAEKHGTKHERPSALDGIPTHLPALMRAEKLRKKARKAGLVGAVPSQPSSRSKAAMGKQLFALAAEAQQRGWSAEELLRKEVQHEEKSLRRMEANARNNKSSWKE